MIGVAISMILAGRSWLGGLIAAALLCKPYIGPTECFFVLGLDAGSLSILGLEAAAISSNVVLATGQSCWHNFRLRDLGPLLCASHPSAKSACRLPPHSERPLWQ